MRLEWYVARPDEPTSELWGPFATAEEAEAFRATYPDARLIECQERKMPARIREMREARRAEGLIP